MPSVTMNDGMLQCTLTNPLTSPATKPVATQISAAGASDHPQSVMAIPRTAAPSAITEPTERSMPAMISTNVMPTAITIRSGI